MNPAVLTRLGQLELEWQQRLLRQPSSGQANMKKGVATLHRESLMPDPEVVYRCSGSRFGSDVPFVPGCTFCTGQRTAEARLRLNRSSMPSGGGQPSRVM